MTDLVVFSDLDGTLLEHHGYGHAPAAPALAELKARGVPLVLCSSKTRSEMIPLWRELELDAPFVSENGGGVFAPAGHPLADGPDWRDAGEGWQVLPLGLNIDQVRLRLAGLPPDLEFRGFGQLGDAQVAELTGLTLEAAALARRREFNEPLVLAHPQEDGAVFRQAAQRLGLTVTQGGRFWHALGGGDKGRAVRLVAEMYRRRNPETRTMALGDAPNDAPMLAAVDYPVLVAQVRGGHAPLDLPGLVRQPEPGPTGWNRAVLDRLAAL